MSRVMKLKKGSHVFFTAEASSGPSVIRIDNSEHVGATALLDKIREQYGKETYEANETSEVIVLNLVLVTPYSFNNIMSVLSSCNDCTVFLDNLDWVRDETLLKSIETAIVKGLQRGNTYLVVTNNGFHTEELIKGSTDYKLVSYGEKSSKSWALDYR